jgi:hypothetical protein
MVQPLTFFGRRATVINEPALYPGTCAAYQLEGEVIKSRVMSTRGGQPSFGAQRNG